MATQPLLPRPSPGHVARVEYLGFQEVDEHREFRFRVYGLDGSREFRMRITKAAFDTRQVRLQDGPDVCYHKLLRAVAAGVMPQPDLIMVDEVDLCSYRDEHTQVLKRRSRKPSPPATPVVGSPRQSPYRPRAPRPESPRLPVAPPVTNDVEPALSKGQRVNHAVFGMGVTTETTGAHTVVRFDRDGPKTFVASMLEVEVLSAPHTWETSPRGTNRPCKTPSAE